MEVSPVIIWLLGQLGSLLGLNAQMSPQDVVNRTAPGCTKDFSNLFATTFGATAPKTVRTRM